MTLPEHQPDERRPGSASTRELRLRPRLIINTGEGKGKTTAAMGTALRAWQQGWSTGVFQFVKSGRWGSGEHAALQALGALHESTGAGGPVEWHALGQGLTFTRAGSDAEDQAAAAQAGWQLVSEQLAAGRHQLYLLDELTYPINWGWLDCAEVVRVLRDRPGHQHVIITGRRAPQELIEIADLVTSMTKIKHPFDQGEPGQAGIEW